MDPTATAIAVQTVAALLAQHLRRTRESAGSSGAFGTRVGTRDERLYALWARLIEKLDLGSSSQPAAGIGNAAEVPTDLRDLRARLWVLLLKDPLLAAEVSSMLGGEGAEPPADPASKGVTFEDDRDDVVVLTGDPSRI
jgi:hypothetical protein